MSHEQNASLLEELTSINAIYGPSTTTSTSNTTIILSLPTTDAFTFLLSFPPDYPSTIPTVDGTHSTSPSTKPGEGKHAVEVLRETLQTVWHEGEVCLFDLIEEGGTALQEQQLRLQHHREAEQPQKGEEEADDKPLGDSAATDLGPEPDWTLGEPVTEKKSVFIARAVAVKSKTEATDAISHLLSTNNRVAGASHNITAYRIRVGELVIQDCDDDGEWAAGGRLLRLLQMMDVWDVLVVVSRWYGGHKLGSARFGIINAVGRDALVKGGWYKEKEEKGGKKGKK